MLGYFILKEDAEKLGLLNNSDLVANLQSTFFVVTERDVSVEDQLKINPTVFNSISNFLNKNYFDNMVELIINLAKTNKQ